MGFLSWIVMGLITGVLAKLIMPGKGPEGLITTILVGIAGAFIGGFIGSLLGLGIITGFNRQFSSGCRRCCPAVDSV